MSGINHSTSKKLTIQEASAYAGISVSTLRRRIKSGAIAVSKIKSRYGDEYLIKIEDLDRIKKVKAAPWKKAVKTTVKPSSPKIKTEKPKPVKKVKAVEVKETVDADLNKIAALQNQELDLLSQETFDREKFRRNWRELGRLIENKITEGQLQITELSHILREKDRLMTLKEARINNLTVEIKDQAEEIKLIRRKKSLLRQFAEYLRGLFTDDG